MFGAETHELDITFAVSVEPEQSRCHGNTCLCVYPRYPIMTRPLKYTTQQVLTAIRGSGGIKSRICRTLDCHLETFNAYLKNNPRISAAFAEEEEIGLDLAQSVVMRNIQLAGQIQQGTPSAEGVAAVPARMADTTDAKWLLSRKGRHRGFGDAIEVETTTGFENMAPEEITERIQTLMAKAKARKDKKKKNAEASN